MPTQIGPQPIPNASQWKAFRAIGYIANIDFVILTGIAVNICLTAYFFHAENFFAVLGTALILFALLCGWIVLLIYRAVYFTLQVWCELKDLPETAARLAIKHIQGQ